MEPHVGVDVDGTFTDVTLISDSETLVIVKVPSTADQSEGVITGIKKACVKADIDPADLEEFSYAMTVSMNVLLKRAGAKPALVTTEGFQDVLEIGRQSRLDLYELHGKKPASLIPRAYRYELAERATPSGTQEEIDDEAVYNLIGRLRAGDIESIAIAFLHAYAILTNKEHVAAIFRSELDVPIPTPHEVLSEFREFERTSTTVVDAYVTPAIDIYIRRLTERAAADGIPESRIMQSNGGIADADTVRTHAVATTLSEPAAGVVGTDRAARSVRSSPDLPGLVTFDMGGTSSDVSLVRDGEAERTVDTSIDGIPIRTPMVDINTIGSGGGSITWVDSGGVLRVGPRSAGADPGPACYGRGSEKPTVTERMLCSATSVTALYWAENSHWMSPLLRRHLSRSRRMLD